jgi:hypothetical protein
VCRGERGPAEVLTFHRSAGAEVGRLERPRLRMATDDDGDGDLLVRIDRAQELGTGQGPPIAAGDVNPGRTAFYCSPPVRTLPSAGCFAKHARSARRVTTIPHRVEGRAALQDVPDRRGVRHGIHPRGVFAR